MASLETSVPAFTSPVSYDKTSAIVLSTDLCSYDSPVCGCKGRSRQKDVYWRLRSKKHLQLCLKMWKRLYDVPYAAKFKTLRRHAISACLMACPQICWSQLFKTTFATALKVSACNKLQKTPFAQHSSWQKSRRLI